jgi:hypothetical protein
MSTTAYKSITLNNKAIEGYNVKNPTRVVNEGYLLFFNCQHLLIQLPPVGRSFFDFLCEKMRSDDNSILMTKEVKSDFIEHITKITSKKTIPKEVSINKYVSQFKDLGLLISLANKRGYYCINPRYAFKGSKEKRAQVLKKLIEAKCRKKESIKGLVSTSQEEEKGNK